MSFLERFQTSLESLYLLPENSDYVVAYSGGVDSHVLLHCCCKLGIPVRAVHVHHGLQRVADDWVVHCQVVCEALNIPLDIVYVDASKQQGQSPEETARRVRYQALRSNLQKGDCLLTAQHLNDQAETLLLQLFRTSSTAGLAAMPSVKRWSECMHLRPMLSFSRQEIVDYATQNNLHWTEDPSNQDVQFDRNFIRSQLVPMLEHRWPEITRQLSTVAGLQANNLSVLEDMAAIDLANTVKQSQLPYAGIAYEVISVLSLASLRQLSSARLLNVLRYWIKQKIQQQPTSKTSPTRNLLEEIERTLVNSNSDVQSVIVFSGYEYRKYQGDLYLLKQRLTDSTGAFGVMDLQWSPSQPIFLSLLNSQLKAVDCVGGGLKNHLLEKKLKISFRQGGEQFHPVGRQHSQSLKKLLQEANIPPWERKTIPLLYCDGELVAVVGLWVARQSAVDEGESGWLAVVEGL